MEKTLPIKTDLPRYNLGEYVVNEMRLIGSDDVYFITDTHLPGPVLNYEWYIGLEIEDSEHPEDNLLIESLNKTYGYGYIGIVKRNGKILVSKQWDAFSAQSYKIILISTTNTFIDKYCSKIGNCDEPIVCDYHKCNYKFYYEKSLILPAVKHLGNYKCPKCGFVTIIPKE